jgi:aspartyl-tRNA(Asn)/glutamyl-tRNA(Gln) amidotransferase subunit A
MDHVGVVTRTVQDAALMLQGIAGHATGDATTFDEVVPDFSDRLGRSGAGARVGVLARSVEDSDDGVRHVFDEAMQQLRKLGVDVVAVDDDALRCAGIAGAVILAAEAGASHTPWLRAHRDSYGVQTRRYLEMGALIPARYLLAAYQARERIRSALREAFERQALDALASPTTPLAAMPLDKMIPSRHLERYTSNTIPANLAGLPAISVPCGFVGGLPVGLQLIGRPFAEAELLGIAAAYEREAPFAHRRPTLPI